MIEWAKQIIARTRRTGDREATLARHPLTPGHPSRLIADRLPVCWRQVIAEFKRAAGACNAEAKATLVTVQVGTADAISVRRPTFPAAYLDLMPHPDTGTYTVRVEFYRTHSAAPRIEEATEPFVVAGDDLALDWRGLPRTPAQFVSEMMQLMAEGT